VHFTLPKIIVDTQSSKGAGLRKLSIPNNKELIKIAGAKSDTLAALFGMANSQELGTIILLHGIRGNKEHFTALAAMLNRQGYNTLALDLRAHGDSEGDYCTYGYYEKYDVQKALDYLLTKGLDSNIGVWGQSLGGAIALQTLAIEPKLKFGIIESTFSEFTTIVDDYSERMFGFSIPFVNQYALYRASEIANFKPEEVSPQESAKKIRQPVLVAHGTADTHIKFAYGKTNFDKLASDQKIFLPIEGAVHHNLWQVGGKTYFEKVFSFLSSFNHNEIRTHIPSNSIRLPSDKRTKTKY
jgi:alpha-beta hydrolase superfamily lysophospholipase